MIETNPENMFAIGRTMRVRKLSGLYQIVDSRMIGKNRRYKLRAVPDTGAALPETEAYGDVLQPMPDPAPAPELSLMPDPAPSGVCICEPGYADTACPQHGDRELSQEHASPDGQPEPAPVAERAAPDAIRSPDGFDTYPPGANRPELQNPFKPIRRFPVKMAYADLKDIVYNARFKGLEDQSSRQLSELPDGTPVAVAVTKELNGNAIWVITTDSRDEIRQAHLEVFYPKAIGSSADALEYAVLLALRQVPIRTEDLEILLLELG